MVRNYDPDKPVAREVLERSPPPRSARRVPGSAGAAPCRCHGLRPAPAHCRASATSLSTSMPGSTHGSAARRRCSSRRERGDLPRPIPRAGQDPDDGTEIDWPIPYWYVDVGATMMLILLAAVDEGLAAGFLGTHRFPELSKSRSTVRPTTGRRDHCRLPTPRSPIRLA